jgi:hypothetical protein
MTTTESKETPRRRRNDWAIGWFEGCSPHELSPAANISNPIMTASRVTDFSAEFVADPFLLRRDGIWHMFFEALNAETRRGVIALAISPDGRYWQYRGVVLDEPFHLSYPFVFEHGGQPHMIPETLSLAEVRLYRALRFPDRWEPAATLISGEFADPTLVRHLDRWWLFVCDAPARHDRLRLFQAPTLFGRWVEHPYSPIVAGDPMRARPAGRIVRHGGRLVRFAQNCTPVYGSSVHAARIIAMNETVYIEEPFGQEPVLQPGRGGWLPSRMHHVDAWQVGPAAWVACVDGASRPG